MSIGKLIYVVDDEREICDLVRHELERYGHTVKTFQKGQQLEQALAQKSPQLCIIDLGLPDMDGLGLVRLLMDSCETGIIILSGRNSLPDRVLGLELGADDYISKPFDPRELVARANSILRRIDKTVVQSEGLKEQTRAHFDVWDFDSNTLTLTNKEGHTEELSAGESELLLCLLRSPKQILSRNQLMEHREESFDRSIDVRMSRIRKKIEVDPKLPRLIKTVYGMGYMLTTDVAWD